MKKLLLFILFVSTVAAAQEQRYDNFAATLTSASGIGNLTQVIPNATITVFNQPAVGVSCAGGGCVAATTFTSRTGGTPCGGGLPLTRPTTNVCVATADASANFGFWAAAGAYQYCVAATNFTTQCFNVILSPTLDGVNNFSATNILTNQAFTTACNAAGGGLCFTFGPQSSTNGTDNGHNSNVIEFLIKDNSGNPQYNFEFMDTTPGPKQGSIRFVTGTSYPVASGGGLWTDGPIGVDAVAFASLPACSAVSEGANAEINDGKSTNCGDAACTTWHTTVTGGTGALKLWIHCNGTNWTLAAF